MIAIAYNVRRLAAVWEFEKLLFIIKTKVQMSTKDEAMTVSPNGQQPDVSRSYLVLYESNPDRTSGSIEKFDGEIMSSTNFEANKAEDFATMKKCSYATY